MFIVSSTDLNLFFINRLNLQFYDHRVAIFRVGKHNNEVLHHTAISQKLLPKLHVDFFAVDLHFRQKKTTPNLRKNVTFNENYNKDCTTKNFNITRETTLIKTE